MIQIIRAAYLRKELESSGKLLAQQAGDSSNDPDILIEKAEEKLQKLSQEDSKTIVADFRTVMKSTMKTIKEHFAARADGELVGMDLSITELNARTGGARKGELTIIAGRPGMSKSGLCLNIVEANSMSGTKRGLVFSLEMSNEIVGERLIAQKLGTNLSNLNTGFFSKAEMSRLFAPVECKDCGSTELSQTLDYKKFDVQNVCIECGSLNVLNQIDAVMDKEYPIHIIQQAGLSIYQICSLIKSHKLKFPDLEYVIVDHLHCVGYAPGANRGSAGSSCSFSLPRQRGRNFSLMASFFNFNLHKLD